MTPQPTHYLANRPIVSPATVVAWGHVVVVIVVLVSPLGRVGIFLAEFDFSILGLFVVGGLTVLSVSNAWLLSTKQLVGYGTFVGTTLVELWIWHAFSHSISRRWRLDGLVAGVVTIAVAIGEVLWLLVTHRLERIAE